MSIDDILEGRERTKLQKCIDIPHSYCSSACDIGRLIGSRPLTHIGTFMMRKPKTFQLFVVGTAGVLAGMDQMELKKAVLGGGSMVATTKYIGLGMKFGVSNLINKKKTLAEDAGLNNNVIQKRSAIFDRKREFWERVYEPESQTIYTEEGITGQKRRWNMRFKTLCYEIMDLPPEVTGAIYADRNEVEHLAHLIMSKNLLSPSIPKIKYVFYNALSHALTHDYDRETQNWKLGFDVNLIEDYARTAILTHDDNFVTRCYTADKKLQHAKTFVKHYFDDCTNRGKFDMVRNIISEQYRLNHKKMWHSLFASSFTTKVGKAIHRLDKIYDTDKLTAQTVMMNGLEDLPWVAQYKGMAKSIRQERRQIHNDMFGKKPHQKEKMIRRLCEFDVWQSMELRRKFDYLYMDPDSNKNWAEDLVALCRYDRIPKAKEIMEESRESLQEFETWLKDNEHLWHKYMDDSDEAMMRHIVKYYHRFENYMKEYHEDLLTYYYNNHVRIKEALMGYKSDEQLSALKIKPELVNAFHEYIDFLLLERSDLFSTMNIEKLRAAKIAFHANYKNLRKHFYEGDQASLIEIAGEAIGSAEDITLTLRQVRTYNALAFVQSQIRRQFADDLCVNVEPKKGLKEKIMDKFTTYLR